MSDTYVAVKIRSLSLLLPYSSLSICNRSTDMITFVFSLLSRNTVVVKRWGLESNYLGLSPASPTCQPCDLGKTPYGSVPKVHLPKEKL